MKKVLFIMVLLFNPIIVLSVDFTKLSVDTSIKNHSSFSSKVYYSLIIVSMIFLIIISTGIIYAQSGNAKSLELGNQWVYYVNGIFVEKHYRSDEVIGDTIINNKKYAVILENSLFLRYERADSLRIFRFDTEDSTETVIADFSLDVDDSLNSSVVTSKGSISIWGRTFTEICLFYEIWGLYFEKECYTELIGLTYGYYGGMAINDYDISLKAALIEGRIYGDTNLVSVKEPRETLPVNYNLQQNYPNPFNPLTSIQYSIGSTQFITLTVYDILGKEISILVNEEKQPGKYEIKFDANKYGLSSGIYFYRLEIDNATITKKAVFIK